LERFSRRRQSPFAHGNGDLLLSKPVKSATLATKAPVFGEYGYRWVRTFYAKFEKAHMARSIAGNIL
jgi:hypothetical protein